MKRRRGGGRPSLSTWLFVIPALGAYVAFLVSPALQSIGLSFTDWNGMSRSRNFIGIGNYVRIFDDPTAMTAMGNNLLWTVVTIIVPVVLGLLLAVFLNGAAAFKPFLRTVFYMPAVLPMVGVATIWTWLYDPTYGSINAFLRQVGLGSLAQSWLGQDSTAFGAIMVAGVWVRTGFPMLIYLASLQTIPAELYEAAKVDGANAWQSFWYITMPRLRAGHYVVLALSLVDSFKVFDIVYAMTYGGPGNSTQVLGTWMYFNVFQYFDAGYGISLAVVITIVAVLSGIPYVISQMKADK